MATLRTILVDDEELARKGLRLRLAEFPEIEIIGECEDGSEALKTIEELEPDLVFLDIEMPELTGIEVVTHLQADAMPMIVFVTAYDQYAVNAFELHAVDYLLKPIENERLVETIARIKLRTESQSQESEKEKLISFISKLTGAPTSEILTMVDDEKESYPSKIAIKDRDETVLVRIEDIAWVEAAGDYMCVHANGQVHVLRSTMKELERKLNPTLFQRVHRSTIVNVSMIDKVTKHINGEYHLILNNKSSLKMSRSYRDKIKHIL